MMFNIPAVIIRLVSISVLVLLPALLIYIRKISDQEFKKTKLTKHARLFAFYFDNALNK